jgi:acylphosphatase
MPHRSVRLIIRGRVQGVGFRQWTQREASARGLDGWVRNLPDGTVEALIAGPTAAVRGMIEACHKGPMLAAVTEIHEHAAEAPDEAGFCQIR